MTANPDFDAEKAKADAKAAREAVAYHKMGEFHSPHEWRRHVKTLEAHLTSALAALSRPAGDVGKLVERLRKPHMSEETMVWWDGLRVWIKRDTGSGPRDAFEAFLEHIDEERQQAADALTALSSAPVDAGVEELARRILAVAVFCECRDGKNEFFDACQDAAQTLRTLSRQLTTERQAWGKVRAEIEELTPDAGRLDFYDCKTKVRAILAQHTPQAGKEG